MSRLLKFWSRFFMRASPLRTYAETVLLFFALTLLLWLIYGGRIQDLILISLLFLIVPCCGLYYALRLRPPRGRWLRRLASDALWIAVPCLVFNGLIIVYVHDALKVFQNDPGNLWVYMSCS